MFMAMDNLIIVQHWDFFYVLQFVELVIGLKFVGLSLEICVLITHNIDYIDVIAKHVILRVRKVLFFGVLLEGQDNQTWNDHVRNCASCHLLHMGSHIDLSLVVILV
jgi:hypothetical protein